MTDDDTEHPAGASTGSSDTTAATPAALSDPDVPEGPSATGDAPPAPPPSPLAALPTGAGSVLRLTFDLLTRASPELRRGSFYIGLIVVGLIGPVALLEWGFVVAANTAYQDIIATPAAFERAADWSAIAAFLALAGFVIAFVESRAVAIAILGARLEGRRLELRDAVQRSRQVFWRVAGGLLLINVPLGIFQIVAGNWFVDVFHGASEISALTPSIAAAVIGTPFAYVMSGIVLGDVGVVESARRSVRIFAARRRAALVVSLFSLAAQLLTVAAILAGLDILVRAFEAVGIGPTSGDAAIAMTTALVVIVVFAFGTLLFTVAALSVAPQVVMFLALTHATFGLDRIADDAPPDRSAAPPRRRFRWLTRPMLAAIVVGALVAVAGLATLAR